MKKIIFLLLTFITLNIQAQVDWAELNGNVLFTNGVDSISFIIDSTGVPADSLYIYGTKPIKIKTSNDLVVNDFFYVYDNDSVSIDFGDDVMNFYYSDDTNYIKTDSVVVINGLVINPSGGHWTQNGDKIYYNTGNVGINTTNPQYRLEVDGRASVDTLNIVDSLLQIGGNQFLKTDYLNNIYIGSLSGYSNPTGSKNVFLGTQSGYDNTTGSSNFFLGYRSGYNNTTGIQNVFIGTEAGRENTTGQNNLFLGYKTGVKTTTGGNNVFLGLNAGNNNLTGSNSVYIGLQSGYNATGSSNVFFGYQAGYNETGSNKLYIENSNSSVPLIYGDFSTNYLKFNVDSVRNTGDYYAKNIAIEDTYTGITSATFQNKSAAAAAVVGTLVKVINNSGYWGAIGMTNTGSTIQSGTLINTFQNYNQGYGDFLFTNDGNVDFRWFSDPTNSHNFSAMGNEIMKLEANGDLTVSRNTYSDSVFSHHFGGLSAFSIGASGDNLTINGNGLGITVVDSISLSTPEEIDIVSGDIITLNSGANNTRLTAQPTGTTALAIATTKYVDDNAGSVSFGTSGQNPYMNTGGTDFIYSNNYKYDATRLTLKSSTGNSNLFIGSSTTGNNTLTGSYNTFIGDVVGSETTSGQVNVIIGVAAGGENTTGSYNAFYGNNAGGSNTTGSYNSYIGINSGAGDESTGSYNTGLGYFSLHGIEGGVSNTAIGHYAGSLLVSGDSNVFVGNEAGYYETGSNKLMIDVEKYSNEANARDSSLIYGDFAADQLTINGGQLGNVTTVNAATYDLLTGDYILLITYTATGAVTSLTLPTAQTVTGRTIVIKDSGNASTNSITIDTQASQTIDGAATLVINSDYESVNLFSDGTNWYIY